VEGTPQSVNAIRAQDVKAYHRSVFARDTLKVVAVGDIDAKTLGELLDRIFGELPDKAQLTPVPEFELKGSGKVEVVDMPVPQSAARFGMGCAPTKSAVRASRGPAGVDGQAPSSAKKGVLAWAIGPFQTELGSQRNHSLCQNELTEYPRKATFFPVMI
ncbi:MAG: insulinase family protein, partial [Anaerolinea sp.]|nr:insulinase family protein [Anaerolinea sp.]